VAVSLVFSAFLLCRLATFVLKDAIADQEKIELAEKKWNFISRHFARTENGDLLIPKENYQGTPGKKGIRLIERDE
jgi:serine/threonine protein kinase HipA of HipAB toxin-antitoxin module